MSRLIDLTGKTFGDLTVINRTTPHKLPSGKEIPKWHCKCSCGKEIDVLGSNLRNGNTTSCGHEVDLTGKHFGELIVIKKEKEGKQHNQTTWKCQCSCGNIVIVKAVHLNHGAVKSCGHNSIEAIRKSVMKDKTETPGTRLSLLNNHLRPDSKTGYRNITIQNRYGKIQYRVSVVYKKKQYSGVRNTLQEALQLREELRFEHWPNYKGLPSDI